MEAARAVGKHGVSVAAAESADLGSSVTAPTTVELSSTVRDLAPSSGLFYPAVGAV
eukprot:SAG11_NODE_206_length_12389_cov_11.831192_4_plen_56_part_00